MQTLRTTILTSYKNRALLHGSVIAGVGVAIIFLFYFIAPLHSLGIWAYLVGLILIAIGLIPYRKLSHLELHPHILEMNAESLIYTRRGKEPMVIARKDITDITFFEKKNSYGIVLTLRSKGKNITLRYFSRRSFERLLSFVTVE